MKVMSRHRTDDVPTAPLSWRLTGTMTMAEGSVSSDVSRQLRTGGVGGASGGSAGIDKLKTWWCRFYGHSLRSRYDRFDS